ncbi:Os08g0166450 [Oryza sativa Japonica Group]|uniref:Os08g0166450 protein n=1 Tax=Oryza sativa subsp. japonica TaxID=39947 RepID=C7J667_ORYSJ|nr:Os08g0166450 [Oryza sativa Japonica Group]|eukprot:NP_001175400.1 Os08g0166450 [Oryza sativa Japonica Group]
MECATDECAGQWELNQVAYLAMSDELIFTYGMSGAVHIKSVLLKAGKEHYLAE